jgi:AraC-like DNA-binding protein
MSLLKLFSRQKALVLLLQQAATALPEAWWVEGTEGQVIFGAVVETAGVQASPVRHHDAVWGWVKSAGVSAPLVANLLNNWLRQEEEKKQLGAETLHLYREINLIFNFSEKLAAAPGVTEIARLTLQEARQVIGFEAGAVFFGGELAAGVPPVAVTSADLGLPADWLAGQLTKAQSEILTLPGVPDQMVLLAALKIGDQARGGVVLRAANFTAADLKLLSTLAAQAASALENADRHQRATEQALKTQREQLTLELALRHPFFKKMVTVASARCGDPAFSVSALAEALHLSASQLQRKVLALTDLTPVQIIRDLRLKRAKDLLRNTDLTVAEVAFEAGFNDPSYFTRLFVKELGRSPSEWRKG